GADVSNGRCGDAVDGRHVRRISEGDLVADTVVYSTIGDFDAPDVDVHLGGGGRHFGAAGAGGGRAGSNGARTAADDGHRRVGEVSDPDTWIVVSGAIRIGVANAVGIHVGGGSDGAEVVHKLPHAGPIEPVVTLRGRNRELERVDDSNDPRPVNNT